jgi:hypothetical protein
MEMHNIVRKPFLKLLSIYYALEGGVHLLLKKKILASIILLISIYLIISLWIMKDTKAIIEMGMQNGSDYSEFMTEDVYNTLNPLKNGIKDWNFNPDSHDQRFVFPIHLFFIAKAWTNHKYESTKHGFHEPVSLTLKLIGWKWKAVAIKIKP